jgi:flagellar export protein FliJ
MKSLPTLIKLCQQKIEEIRKSIATREEEREHLQHLIKEIERHMQEEQALVAKDPSMSMTLEACLKMFREQKKNAMHAIHDIERQLIHLKEDMADLFMDKKKFEILLEQQQAKLAKEEQSRENAELNEIALRQFSSES